MRDRVDEPSFDVSAISLEFRIQIDGLSSDLSVPCSYLKLRVSSNNFFQALAHFGKFYLTIAHTASNFTLFPTLFGMLEPIQDSLKDHSWLLNLTILGDAVNRLYQAMPASKPHQTMKPKPKPKPTEKDIPWAKEIVGSLGGLGYHKIFC